MKRKLNGAEAEEKLKISFSFKKKGALLLNKICESMRKWKLHICTLLYIHTCKYVTNWHTDALIGLSCRRRSSSLHMTTKLLALPTAHCSVQLPALATLKSAKSYSSPEFVFNSRMLAKDFCFALVVIIFSAFLFHWFFITFLVVYTLWCLHF